MVFVIKSKIIFVKSVAMFVYQLMLKIIFAILHRKRIHKKNKSTGKYVGLREENGKTLGLTEIMVARRGAFNQGKR